MAVDGGHNGCDTRNDILRRDLTAVSLDPQSVCTVRTGTLEDVYTGDSVAFDDVVIDHVVSLRDAWQKGAYELDAETSGTWQTILVTFRRSHRTSARKRTRGTLLHGFHRTRDTAARVQHGRSR
ncbi:HNH endonuclease family protein [Rhodococcus sp. BUPNP1]|uniref:HNH endonuclease family protein n=1 Tax=Rhodococcus sp. BUPNP1 TaxID=1432786 RepID=UPI00209BEFF7|nr:HNH endonuclease family protein [Rhodococcus sp. BUPNP1]